MSAAAKVDSGESLPFSICIVDGKALACAACRVESRTRRSGGMADAADSKSVGRKAVWVRLPPPAPTFSNVDSYVGSLKRAFSRR